MERAKQFEENLNKRLHTHTKASPLSSEDTIERAAREFVFECEGSGQTAESIRTYTKHIDKICEFLGYFSMEGEPDYKTSRKECRSIGYTMPIHALNKDDIAYYYHDYLTNICMPPLAEQTVITCMRNFRVFYRWLAHNKLVRPQEIKIKVVDPPIKEVFTPEEIHRLTSKKPDHNNQVEYRCWVMTIYLLWTGNRIGSILGLKVGDIDFDNNEIRVQFMKNRSPKIIPMDSHIKGALSEWIRYYRTEPNGTPKMTEPLFCNTYGESMTYNTVSDAFEDYFYHRRVEWSGFHKFRHSYAAHWIRDGGDSLTLKTQLGHNSLAMTNRYANLYGKAIEKEVREHSLGNEVRLRSGRKKIKPNE